MRRTLLPFAFSIMFVAASAGASTLTVSESGVFGSATPATAYSAPGGTFTYSFTVSSMPAVSAVDAANYFNVDFSNFSYTLNGVTSTPTVGSITVYNLVNEGGLFDVCFVTACDGNIVPALGLQFTGGQIYSGSEISPTILAGTYLPTSAYFGNTPLNSATAVTIAATPEPTSIALLGSGLAAAAAMRFRRHRP